jgi:transposase
MGQKSGSVKEPAKQVVKEIRRATRRQFSAEEKIRIVLTGLRGEAAGGRQEQPKANRRDANPARKARAWASVFSPWPLAKPDKNFTRHVPAIAQTTSASRCSATSARGGSRSAMANSMRHRPQRSGRARQPDPRS